MAQRSCSSEDLGVTHVSAWTQNICRGQTLHTQLEVASNIVSYSVLHSNQNREHLADSSLENKENILPQQNEI